MSDPQERGEAVPEGFIDEWLRVEGVTRADEFVRARDKRPPVNKPYWTRKEIENAWIAAPGNFYRAAQREARREALNEMRRAVDRYAAPPHTLSSENADMYRGFQNAALRMRKWLDAEIEKLK
jgi:hypothetical protein